MGEAEWVDWVTQVAENVISDATEHERAGDIVCASGISPSGPIHLGNLREVMVQHLVADEIRFRGLPCRHVLFWDDYDRLRRVPAGVPDAFSDHIGRPLSAVPDPAGEYASWAERFQAPFRIAVAALGVELEEVSQTERYTTGAYAERVIGAMQAREKIGEVLAQYRTLDQAGPSAPPCAYYPYQVYCEACGRDTTVIDAYDDASTELEYTCRRCGNSGQFILGTAGSGKLVWKVDWPMRWAYEPVSFEAAGVDHSSPNS